MRKADAAGRLALGRLLGRRVRQPALAAGLRARPVVSRVGARLSVADMVVGLLVA